MTMSASTKALQRVFRKTARVFDPEYGPLYHLAIEMEHMAVAIQKEIEILMAKRGNSKVAEANLGTQLQHDSDR